MSDQEWPDTDPHGLPEAVSVSFKPEGLTRLEEWRMVLTRIAPGARRPVLRVVIGVLYILTVLTGFGYWIGWLAWPKLQPESMAFAFFVVSLLFPFRIWRIKRQLVGALRSLSPLTIQVSPEFVTLLSKNRVTRIDWAGVLDVRSDRREVVLRYRAGDASWIPARAFASPEHEAKFLEVARSGLARTRPVPTSFAPIGRPR